MVIIILKPSFDLLKIHENKYCNILALLQSRVHVINLNKWATFMSRLIRRINKEMN